MKAKQSIVDGCAARHALDLVGDRWALLVVRELVLGPKRFTDVRAGLPGISPNVLTQRLEELERSGIVHRRKLPPPAAAWVYELTEWGLELEPVIQSLGRWAARSPFLPQGVLNVDSLILSFRTMFDARAAEGFDASIELRIGEERFHAELEGGRMTIVRGSAVRPDAIIEGESEALGMVAYGGVKFADALRAGELKVEGDRAVAKKFLTLFPLPERVPQPAAARE
jgi:DNA-binding HxlR family transcriptional regulator/putative sterol carrier protein